MGQISVRISGFIRACLRTTTFCAASLFGQSTYLSQALDMASRGDDAPTEGREAREGREEKGLSVGRKLLSRMRTVWRRGDASKTRKRPSIQAATYTPPAPAPPTTAVPSASTILATSRYCPQLPYLRSIVAVLSYCDCQLLARWTYVLTNRHKGTRLMHQKPPLQCQNWTIVLRPTTV